ncbi:MULTISPECIES: UvrY/SirA/GacA family response regulator transcription factor [Modicisalibacter]|uniref:UvrY/SirA/GacA family response regulator transcription factor n=1 Tax=Modicisalibacter TaxID=574347 RepID=UPI00100ACC71|nr:MULTISPECIES: UvrY/SirA/GacA family response regulator transcription factor [Halomonadaceae]MBZ9560299.1 UvrY/SirA/GacA family response regulator transcription factor [Modicisalibacter sp. R2A 31.J]MBZ9576208.1 UvrY/SirA/GacA family response regulator transcription factor [Modicisalibacter sp. MOD 31.J]
MIRVLVADDHHLVRTSIARMLDAEEGLRVVGEAADGEEAISQARNTRPDLVLMDIRMPGIGGLEATRKIARGMSDIKVIVLTAYLEDTFAQRLLDAGASGFISKGTELDEMVRAIHCVHAGQRYISPDIAQRLVLAKLDSQENPFDQLSSRELQVAMMIVNCHKVSEISDSLFLSPKTVNTYRYRIFEKLGVQSDVELTHLGLRFGLIEDYPAPG